MAGIHAQKKGAKMNIIRRGVGRLPNGTVIYIEDWTCDKCNLSPYVVVAFPVSKATLPGMWSPKFGEKFRYGMRMETFNDAADCLDKLMRGEKQLIDYVYCIERSEYADCVR